MARLRPVALAFTTYPDRLPASADPPPLPAPRAEDLRAALDRLLTVRSELCLEPADRLAEHVESLVPARDALAAARDELDVFEAIYGVPGLVRRGIGRQAAWSDVAAMRQACEDAEVIRAAVVDEPRRGALAILAAWLGTFARAYADERRREGRLWFDDLLVLARDLLRDHPDARTATAARYRCLLVDEFQDTDPLQIELAVLLATSDLDPAARRWSDARIRPGALDAGRRPEAGDLPFPQRRPACRRRGRQRLGLEPVVLVENFRSVPWTLDVVKTVFEEVLTERAGVAGPRTLRRVPTRDVPLSRSWSWSSGTADDEPIVKVREESGGRRRRGPSDRR